MAAISHDEATGVYDVDGVPVARGVHTLPKHRMNNYNQCEPVDSATGSGHVHLGTSERPYSLMHKVAGQNRIITKIARPESTGFCKRHALVFGPKAAPESPEAQHEGARKLLQDVHDWMYQNAFNSQATHTLGTQGCC